MRQGLSLTAVGHATSIFLSTTFVLCVGFDLLFPAHAMYQPTFVGRNWVFRGGVCHCMAGKENCNAFT